MRRRPGLDRAKALGRRRLASTAAGKGSEVLRRRPGLGGIGEGSEPTRRSPGHSKLGESSVVTTRWMPGLDRAGESLR
ncbi:hypothetical protein GUJ93_ZPchr0006g44256 [Zizania palustris]|uniref:Uncharacterized protein n=1 Tax=Zizania palustris TaxID=103762 RepID=A0A8J5VS60_ZIZPA|nr:hypothetical protein GUJ93_ZPchr0006g44256 [Zizania palustris]